MICVHCINFKRVFLLLLQLELNLIWHLLQALHLPILIFTITTTWIKSMEALLLSLATFQTPSRVCTTALMLPWVQVFLSELYHKTKCSLWVAKRKNRGSSGWKLSQTKFTDYLRMARASPTELVQNNMLIGWLEQKSNCSTKFVM